MKTALRGIYAALAFLFAGLAPALAADDATIARSPVVVHGTTVFSVTGAGKAVADRRAATIAGRLEAVATDPAVTIDAIHAEIEGSSAAVKAADKTLFIITRQDAAAIDKPLPEAAASAVDIIKGFISSERDERTPKAIAMHVAISFAVLALFAVITWLAWWCVSRLIGFFYARSVRSTGLDVAPGLEVPLRPIVEVAVSALRLIRLVAIGTLAYASISFVLRQFPASRELADALIGPFTSALAGFATGFIGWLPQLAIIVLLWFVAYELITFLRIVRDEMDAGRFRVTNFEPAWIEPTYRLLSFAIVVFAVMAILPHLPGFDSPSFKAVGLVLSALFTFGSATAIANVISGVVLIYAPSFRVGDYVKINDSEGEVITKTLFVTQIRTFKNVVITMPNAGVIGSTVSNFSSMALRHTTPLIVHSTVTLGYDIPWRSIEEALVAAALKTEHIEPEPAPFVLQTALNDYNVSYQVNGVYA